MELGNTYNYLTHQQLTDLQKEINRCNDDRVCVETAKSNAEILSTQQEQQLISDCRGSASSFSPACNRAVLDAYAYATDPLAAQLGLQVDQSITTQNYLSYRPQWGLVVADNAVSHDGSMMIGIAAAGATAGLGAGPGILAAEASGAIQYGSLWQIDLASRTGTALTTGAVNLGAQLVKNNGDISQTNYIDLGASMLGGYLGYGGNMRWNGLVGMGVGMVQTEANNLYYGKNDNVLVGGLTGGVATMVGYRIGDHLTTSMQTPIFTSISPVIWGNVVGPSATEGINWTVEKLKEPQSTQQKVGQ